MLYNNKFNQSHHDNNDHCHGDCHNIAHNHTHNSQHSHDTNHEQAIGHCCDGHDHSSSQQCEIDDPPEDPERSSQDVKLIWKIQGMDCAHCASKIENGVKTLPNINQTKIIFSTEKLIVFVPKHDDAVIKMIEDKVIGIGIYPNF